MLRPALTLEPEDKRVLAAGPSLCRLTIYHTTSYRLSVADAGSFALQLSGSLSALCRSLYRIKCVHVPICAVSEACSRRQIWRFTGCSLHHPWPSIRGLSSIAHSDEGCCWHVTGQLCRKSAETKVLHARTATHIHSNERYFRLHRSRW
jgi:hypothetical protein